MTGNAINAKSEALELHELSTEELDAVSGGDKADQNAKEQARRDQENKEQAQALMTFQQLLQGI